jgi:hypothetical protein
LNVHKSYVTAIVQLPKNGEERLLHAVEKERIPVSVAMQIANQEIENLEKIYVIAVEFFVSNLPGELISGRSWARRTKQNAKIDQHFGHFAPASGREEGRIYPIHR